MDKIRKDWAVMIALAAVSLLVVLNFSAILTWIYWDDVPAYFRDDFGICFKRANEAN